MLTAVLAFVISGCSSDGGDDPVLPLPPAHVHAYSDSWTSNETHHWHAATCGHTDQVKDKAEHDFPETWTEVAAATEEEDGLEERFCSVCEYRETRIIIMLGHNHNVDRNNWTSDETSHWHAADCGRPAHNEDFAPHTEDNGTITKAPTCTEKGLRTYKCTVCDKVLRAEEIAVTGHTEDNGTITSAPTCTEKGLRIYKCTVCGEELRTEEIPAANHTEDSGTVTTAPTCVTKGVRTYMCTVCNGVARKEEIAATGHMEDSGTVTKNVTLDTDGVRTYKCTVCGNERTEPITKPELYESPVDADTGLPATKSSRYIYFGVFPKTVLASNNTVTVDETVSVKMGADTYYKGSDGGYYVKIKENAWRTSTEYKYSDGTQAKQSSSKSYRYFKVEPIKWKVITDSYSYSGKCLLLAEDILTANVPYYKYNSSSNKRTVGSDTGIYPNNYKYSQIRAYLNGLDYYYDESSSSTVKKTDYTDKGFLQTAFTAGAQNLIAVTTVDNSAESTTYSGNNLNEATEYACKDTKDKIFLLSIKEATSYGFPAYDNLGEGNARIRKTTDYAKANSAYSSDGSGCYWLRSPYYDCSYGARFVDSGGFARNYNYVNRSDYGVVPALSISLQ